MAGAYVSASWRWAGRDLLPGGELVVRGAPGEWAARQSCFPAVSRWCKVLGEW